jgi:translation initiation factor 2 subunit 1
LLFFLSIAKKKKKKRKMANSSEDMSLYSECRMYEEMYPEVDALVMVRVNRVTEIGAYVSLLEYNDKEGIILLSNLSRKRIRSVNKHVRVGRQEVLQVLRVDKDKGYIDLSKKLIQKEDIAKCMDRFKNSRQVHSIMQRVAFVTKTPLEELYVKVGWPLYAKHGHAFAAFQQMVTDDALLDQFQEVDAAVRDELYSIVRTRMAIHPVTIQSDVEVTCFAFEGIEAIKPALRAAVACGTDDCPVQVQLITTPLYLMSVSTIDRERGIAALHAAIDAVRENILAAGGNLVVKVEPRVVHD